LTFTQSVGFGIGGGVITIPALVYMAKAELKLRVSGSRGAAKLRRRLCIM